MAGKLYVAAVLGVAACGKPASGGTDAQVHRPDSASRDVATDSAGRPVVLFVGTSLTAGLGVEQDSAFPAVLQRTMDSLHVGYRAINAGVSGETSAGALRRMPWLLQQPPRVLVLETGANDGLRGLDVDSTRHNIDSIIGLVRRRDSSTVIVLVGMEAPPNMGRAFTTRFRAMYPELAQRDRCVLVPFLLAGVGGIDSLNQADGIHPTPRGHRIVAANVWKVLGPILQHQAAS